MVENQKVWRFASRDQNRRWLYTCTEPNLWNVSYAHLRRWKEEQRLSTTHLGSIFTEHSSCKRFLTCFTRDQYGNIWLNVERWGRSLSTRNPKHNTNQDKTTNRVESVERNRVIENRQDLLDFLWFSWLSWVPGSHCKIRLLSYGMYSFADMCRRYLGGRECSWTLDKVLVTYSSNHYTRVLKPQTSSLNYGTVSTIFCWGILHPHIVARLAEPCMGQYRVFWMTLIIRVIPCSKYPQKGFTNIQNRCQRTGFIPYEPILCSSTHCVHN